jgi:hypothetical protein
MVDRVKSKTMKLVFVLSPLLKHTALKGKSKDWLAQSEDNVSEYYFNFDCYYVFVQ